jgi:hypothetical protein
MVTDQKTGRPLGRTTIRFDRPQGEALVATTRENGTYELALSDIPDTFVVAASQPGYLSEARNLRQADVKGKTHRLDFSMRVVTDDVIAIESDPGVHHLGNDQFEGPANSKFQKRSEGPQFTAEFSVSADSSQLRSQQLTVTFLAKGAQCVPQVRVNGHLLTSKTGLSPVDGSYGTLEFPFASSLLKVGRNQVSIKASTCQDDLDDFEFVNVQIRHAGSGK